jgi:hypothetical protein
MSDKSDKNGGEEFPQTVSAFLDTKAIAAHFGRTNKDVREWVDLGCPHVRFGPRFRFSVPAVQTWLDNHEFTKRFFAKSFEKEGSRQ